jgi:hypothetical protein
MDIIAIGFLKASSASNIPPLLLMILGSWSTRRILARRVRTINAAARRASAETMKISSKLTNLAEILEGIADVCNGRLIAPDQEPSSLLSCLQSCSFPAGKDSNWIVLCQKWPCVQSLYRAYCAEACSCNKGFVIQVAVVPGMQAWMQKNVTLVFRAPRCPGTGYSKFV